MKKPFYFLFLLILGSCNTIKYVKENEQLLAKNSIVIDSVSQGNIELNQYLLQKPNAKVLGLPLSLYFYNLGNPNGSKDVTEWQSNHPKTYNTFKRIFSKKQSISIANTFIGFNNWFLKNGQAPIVINNKKIKKSTRNLKTYFQNQGYFKSKVWSKRDTVSYKKGKVTYFVNKGKPLFIDSISKNIKSPVLDSLYLTKKMKSFLRPKEQYNNQNFINESERITKLFRNNGVYHFNINSIGFYDVDTSNYKTNVNLVIDNRVVEKNRTYTEEPYQIQRIKKINVFTDYAYAKKDSLVKVSKIYDGINFFAYEKLKYNPKYLSQSIFLKPNQTYSDSIRNLTKTHLRGLKNFKTTSIRYKELNNKELEANIFLTPIEKYSLGIETELSRSNIRDYDISAKLSLINRNTFKGAETLKFGILGSYFSSRNGPGWEFGTDISLEVPRFMAPFSWNKFVPKTMFPRTRFSLGTNIQKNIGLDKQNFNLGVDYKWNFNKRKTIQVELLNTQYVRNLNTSKYFEIYSSEYAKILNVSGAYNYDKELATYSDIKSFMQQVAFDGSFASTNPNEYRNNLNILNRHNIITSDFLIPVTAYSFTYNNQENYKDQSFSYFRFRIANSGNFLGFLLKETNSLKRKTVFNIPLAQYFKLDIEYKKFWEVSKNSVLGLRGFAGIITPYNNSSIPFSKSYFAGGTNDIRAWKTYNLGPGSRPQGLEYNVGNLKLLSSIEYRFDMIGSLKGAIFIDGGNIWDITNSNFVDIQSKLNDLKSIANIAIGTGFGIRYDLKFLVARLDLGFKVREPYLNNKRWFQNFNFNSANYVIGIGYPF